MRWAKLQRRAAASRRRFDSWPPGCCNSVRAVQGLQPLFEDTAEGEFSKLVPVEARQLGRTEAEVARPQARAASMLGWRPQVDPRGGLATRVRLGQSALSRWEQGSLQRRLSPFQRASTKQIDMATDLHITAERYQSTIVAGWEKLYREKRRRLYELLQPYFSAAAHSSWGSATATDFAHRQTSSASCTSSMAHRRNSRRARPLSGGPRALQPVRGVRARLRTRRSSS